MKTRSVKLVLSAKPVLEGAGVRLHRVFGYSELPAFDPFLLLDDFSSDTPEDYTQGFPWHPHRGMETITYMLKGYTEHSDSMGNKGVIGAGDVQWMTAGSGIIHQELPHGDDQGRVAGFQLWSNLPAADKMMEPRYRGILKEQIPLLRPSGGIEVRVIAGTYDGTAGPVNDIKTAPSFFDITVPPQTVHEFPVSRDHTVFAYAIEGSGYFGPQADERLQTKLAGLQAILFEEGDNVSVRTEDDPLRFLLVSGLPLHEQIAWHGPVVMNTNQEVNAAFEEYRAGTFIKYKPEIL